MWSCSYSSTPTGPDEHSSEKVPLGHAETASINLKIGAGDLHVTGGAADLVDGDFTYNVPSWKPVVISNASASDTNVSIEQQSGNSQGHGHNDWTVKLNDSVATRLKLEFGAGSGHLALGSLNLQRLDVHLGVGDVEIDMRGKLKQDCTATLEGGVGRMRVHLPSDARIEADLTKGIGGIDVKGMDQQDGRYFHQGSANAKTIHLHASSGVGSIEVTVD